MHLLIGAEKEATFLFKTLIASNISSILAKELKRSFSVCSATFSNCTFDLNS